MDDYQSYVLQFQLNHNFFAANSLYYTIQPLMLYRLHSYYLLRMHDFILHIEIFFLQNFFFFFCCDGKRESVCVSDDTRRKFSIHQNFFFLLWKKKIFSSFSFSLSSFYYYTINQIQYNMVCDNFQYQMIKSIYEWIQKYTN